jgi:hypothetical protein
MTALVAILTVVVALLTVLVVGLLRSHAEILRRLHELDPGEDTAPALSPIALQAQPGRRSHDLAGESVHDESVHIAVDATSHRTLVAFLSSGCLTCQEFWHAFDRPEALDLPADMRLVVVTKSTTEESVSAVRSLAPAGVPLVMTSDAWDAYGVPGSPYFVVVDGEQGRVIGEGTGATWEQVRNLIVQADGDARDSREARIDRELLAQGIGPGDAALYPKRANE